MCIHMVIFIYDLDMVKSFILLVYFLLENKIECFVQITSDCECTSIDGTCVSSHSPRLMEHHGKWYGKNISTRRRKECRGMLTSTVAHIGSQRLLRKRESFLFGSAVFGRLIQ